MIKFGKTKNNEDARHNWLKENKPYVYEKMLKYPEKLANGESIAIIQLQYNFQCNFACEHCSINKFQMSKKQEIKSGKKYFNLDDIKELSRQADEMGLANFVISGGEPLTFKDFDELVKAIDPSKFYLVSDTNGWLLDYEKAKHLKEIGIDKIQLSLDGVDSQTHDVFRRKPGSWKRCIDAIEACKKADLHLILSTVVWKDRVYDKEFVEFLEFAKEQEVGVYVSYAKPVGTYEGRYDQMLTEKEEQIIKDLETDFDVFTHMTPSYNRDIGCIAVKRMIPITRYGDVLPCPYMHVSLGNVFEEPLKDIIDRGLNIKWFDPTKNMPCLIGVDMSFIEHVVEKTYGDVQVPVPYYDIFTEDDFINKKNIGKVKKGTINNWINETYEKAPTIKINLDKK